MSRFAEMGPNRRNGRRESVPEGFAAWSRIEDLGIACGYHVSEQFGDLVDLTDAYPALSGRDPEELAEEHPLQALAMLIRRFLADYPETALILAAGTADAAPASGQQGPERAA